MKTIAQPAVITPSIIGLVLLFAAVTFIGSTGKKVPLLSNIRVDIILLVVLGMAICSQGGIGRVAATGEWTHPLSILGYILGGLILLVALCLRWVETAIHPKRPTSITRDSGPGRSKSSECNCALFIGAYITAW